ncbi:MAG: hypothetical protein ACLFVB_08920 [Thermoplasmata archaeon]
MNENIIDGNIKRYRKTMTPDELKQGLQISERMRKNVEKGRREIKKILEKES